MRYVKVRAEQSKLEKAYRIYVTDCLKFISENTARQAGGTSFNKRYAELIDKKPVETRTSEEVIDSIRSKLQKLGG